jgi:hypothetical protein
MVAPIVISSAVPVNGLITLSDKYQQRILPRSPSDQYIDASTTSPDCHDQPKTSQPVQSKRRVRFADGDNNVIEIPTQSFSPELHWGSKGLRILQDESKRVAAEISASRPDVVGSIETFFNAQAEVCSELEMQKFLSVFLQEPEARGIESKLFPTIRVHRQWVVRCVLALQDKLEGEDEDAIRSMLRARSVHASRCSRELALRLAKSDEMEAMRCTL